MFSADFKETLNTTTACYTTTHSKFLRFFDSIHPRVFGPAFPVWHTRRLTLLARGSSVCLESRRRESTDPHARVCLLSSRSTSELNFAP